MSLTSKFTSSHSETDTSQMQYTLTSEVHAGIEFEGSSITQSFSFMLEKATTDSYSSETGVTIDVACETGGVETGLW